MTAGSGGSGAGRPARARPDDCDIRHDCQSRACRGARPGTGDLKAFHGMTRDVAATVAPSPGFGAEPRCFSFLRPIGLGQPLRGGATGQTSGRARMPPGTALIGVKRG